MLRLFSLIFFIMIYGCSPQPPLITRQHQVLAFGTIINITIRHQDSQLIDRAFQRLETDFLTMHRIWHPWEASAMSRTNQLLQTGKPFSAATSVLPLIQRAQQLSIQSNHYFNPAIGKLIAAWGFHRNNPDQPFTPDMLLIEKLQSNIPTMADLEIDGISMRGLNPDIQLDLGGIAKGYGIDEAIKTLQLMGIQHAIINAGGDLRAIGQHKDRPWQIGIQHPRKKGILASIDVISDESIFTSGDYQRYYIHNKKRLHHIIDPKTGEPVSHTIAVTVIHQSGATADAAATALLAAGSANVTAVAGAMGIKHVLLMTQDGKLFISRAMQQRLQLDKTFDASATIFDL